MADVSLNNVYKKFGKTEVIHGISCDIKDGEFIVILGPSGCGKSTILRMIAGLEVITTGDILIDGKVVGAGGSRYCHGISELRPVSPHDGV
jgi:ABC-type sugar transport system ATPase subunit